jgi:uncharacterized membrane protein (GlpM family)
MELVLRFLVGGVVVSLFAMLGGALKPKSFAGLFGAAPSVALATISLTVLEKGTIYAAIEARSMILGAMAFFIYACLVCRLLMRRQFDVLATTSLALFVWLVCATGLLWILLG